MKIKRSISLLLALVLVLMCCPLTPVFAEVTSEGLEYEIDTTTGTVEITNYTGRAPEVVIPDTIEGYPVTSIGDAFSYCSSLTSIDIPDSVTSIGGGAFYGCFLLTSIDIPDSVTSIGGSAFEYCSSLTSIVIPDSVTTIGDYAFNGCTAVEAITVDPNNTVYRSEGNCLIEKETNTLIFGCNKSIIPDGVTSIGYGAFFGCSSLTSIDIPDGVTSIGYGAFFGCSSLTSIDIPDSVTSIGEAAFNGCTAVEAITVDPNNTVYRSEGNCVIEKETNTLIFGCNKSIIPDSVTFIGDLAFEGCSSLTSIDIPDSVTSIGDCAFGGCSSLTSIDIPDGVTSIGDEAFYYCSSLTSMDIPDSVTSIGSGAFGDCSSLTSIDIPDGVTGIGYSAFEGCSSLTSVVIPDSVTSIGDWAFEGCSSLTSIDIPDSVTYIGYQAFVDDSYENLPVTIHGHSGSYAETYANENGFEFVALDKLSVGDANGDEGINASDYTLVKRAVLGTFDVFAPLKKFCDINKDDVINASDYTLLKRVVLGTYTIEQ